MRLPAPQPAQQFTQTETIAENKSFTETANEVAAPKLPPKPVSLKMPEKPKPAEPPKPAAPPAENEAAEKLKKAQEMAKKAAAKNKGKKKNGKGKTGEGEKKNGAAVIILLAVVLLGAGGFFGYQYRKQITGLFYSAYDKTVGKISGNSDQSPYMADITQTLTPHRARLLRYGRNYPEGGGISCQTPGRGNRRGKGETRRTSADLYPS